MYTTSPSPSPSPSTRLRRSVRKAFGVVLIVGCACALTPGRVVAQAGRAPAQDAAHARVGVWRPSSFANNSRAFGGLDPGLVKTIHDKLARISDVCRETPVLKAAIGFEILLKHGVGGPTGLGKIDNASRPPVSGITVMLFNYTQSCETCPIKPNQDSEAQLRLDINALDAFYDDWKQPLETDGEGAMYLAPVRAGEFAGFPMYQAPGEGPVVMITNDNTRPLWLPASQERFIRARIAAQQKMLVGVKPPHDQLRKREIAALEAELSGLSEADRAAPAYFSYGGTGKRRPSRLCAPSDRGARGVVATSTAFFDRSRPRSSFQVAALRTIPADIPIKPPTYFIGKTAFEAAKAIDWKKIASLLQ